MQNAGFAALGLNWKYLACDVRPRELQSALDGAKQMGFLGLNLTVPHKLLAVEMMDVLDKSAHLWGAVNTVRFEARNPQGRWTPLGLLADDPPGKIRTHGFNTDADGLALALQEDLGFDPAGTRVLVLGAGGGAGQVAAKRLARDGAAELFLVNRTASKVRKLAKEIGRRCPRTRVTVGFPEGRVDLLLNATSLGLRLNDPLPLDEEKFQIEQAAAVFDMIYRPTETPLLKLARQRGCKSANGLDMLLWQGAKALEIWTGKAAPVAAMRKALQRELSVKN